MTTYLVYSSIILHILIFLMFVALAIDEVRTRKENKRLAAEYARQKAAYQEELKEAKKVWQKWAEKDLELEQAYQKETNLHERLRISGERIDHSCKGCYYFTSIDKKKDFYLLVRENKWVLPEEPAQQTG